MKNVTIISKLQNWKKFFVVFAIGLSAFLPAYVGWQTEAESNQHGNFLFARLTGEPVNGRVPRGAGKYMANSTSRVLEVEVENISLPGGTTLEVFINGAPIGQIELTSYREGRLRLSTTAGQTIPDVTAGATVEVKHAAVIVVSGAFAAPPTPSPSPSGTHTPPPSPSPNSTPAVVLHAPLTGQVIGGIMPRGAGFYAEFGSSSKKLNVFVGNVNLPGGTILDVLVNDSSIGMITLNDEGKGSLNLSTANGGTVPAITINNPIAVKNGGTAVLTGTFRNNTQPTPSPTANPTPHPNRRFSGRLNGEQTVPPVTTDARGVVHIVLNQDESQARIYLGFARLSSSQTTAGIYAPAMPGETAPLLFDLGTVGGTNGMIAPQTFEVTPEQIEQLRNGLWYAQIGSVNNPGGEIRGQIHNRSRQGGFNGTSGEDIAVFRPSNGMWYIKNGYGFTGQHFGQNGDIPVSGDFDGDGRTDIAVFRNGNWYIQRSSDGGFTARQFGTNGDVPIRGDFDGDGLSDLAVFRPSNGTWYVQKSNGTGFIYRQFGLGTDRPLAADMDGDGKTDIAVFRPSNGTWYWLKSTTGEFRAAQWGAGNDIPVIGDFDGDGADDLSVYRPSNGTWYIQRSSNGTFDFRHYGISSDVPVAGNYDGDGITDIAVFRPANGTWYIWRSSDSGFDSYRFGMNGDVPATK